MHSEYTFKSKYLSVRGHTLHYIDEGSGDVILMVHGNPTWSFFYRNLITSLCKTHRVIALDNIGCGLSDKPHDFSYTLKQHIENLTEFISLLNIESLSLVVHDWGGAIGMGYAVTHTEMLDKIVILNSAAFRSHRIPLRINLCRLPYLGEIIVRGVNGFAFPATFMAVTKKMSKNTKMNYLRPYNSWANRIAVYNFVKDIPLKPSHRSYSTLVKIEKGLEKLNDNDIPIMILWGGQDFCFTKHFYDEWIERLPGSQPYYFEHLGHYILEDGFEEIEPYFKSFFN